MYPMHIKQHQVIETRGPGILWHAILAVELQQTAPVGMPSGREAQHIGHTPLLSWHHIVMPRQKMPGAVAGDLHGCAADIFHPGYLPHHCQYGLAVQRPGNAIKRLGNRRIRLLWKIVTLIKKANAAGGPGVDLLSELLAALSTHPLQLVRGCQLSPTVNMKRVRIGHRRGHRGRDLLRDVRTPDLIETRTRLFTVLLAGVGQDLVRRDSKGCFHDMI